MPFINLKTTETINATKKQTLTTELCRITRECLGKGENWIMTSYEDNASLAFQGSDEAIAYIEVKALGAPSASGTERMTAQVCKLVEKELGVPASRTYVSYFGTNNWGWNGNNF